MWRSVPWVKVDLSKKESESVLPPPIDLGDSASEVESSSKASRAKRSGTSAAGRKARVQFDADPMEVDSFG